jgi:hypothetical protein
VDPAVELVAEELLRDVFVARVAAVVVAELGGPILRVRRRQVHAPAHETAGDPLQRGDLVVDVLEDRPLDDEAEGPAVGTGVVVVVVVGGLVDLRLQVAVGEQEPAEVQHRRRLVRRREAVAVEREPESDLAQAATEVEHRHLVLAAERLEALEELVVDPEEVVPLPVVPMEARVLGA